MVPDWRSLEVVKVRYVRDGKWPYATCVRGRAQWVAVAVFLQIIGSIVGEGVT